MQCAAQTPGTGGIIFSSGGAYGGRLVEEGEAAELHSHQGEGRKRQIALPKIIYNLLRK